jgi:hypothetical protein
MNETPKREDTPQPDGSTFDFAAYPVDTLFHERRKGRDRRHSPRAGKSSEPDGQARPLAERRIKKERRRRIDPTTFEKQYTEDEMEFMNAMQRFKVQTGKSFPSHGDVLKIAFELGYRKADSSDSDTPDPLEF